jgi:RNA polymerase sigma-70 factor (ECF subfamily)
MDENPLWFRRASARRIPAAVDVPRVREQVTGVLPRLRRFARALARNPIEADDLVHTAVVRALARSGQLRVQTRPLVWLLGLVTHAWMDETAARRRQQRLVTTEQSADGISESRHDLLLLQDALGRLPEDQRRAVALVLIERLSRREAAEMEGVPLPTLATRLMRGRQALHRLLGGSAEAGPAGLDETLMAYVDGELEAPARAQLEAAITADETLARRLEEHRGVRERLRRAFDRTLEEPVPERLLSTARSAPTPLQGRNVIPLKRKATPHPIWSWKEVGSVGAALLAGVVLGELLPLHGAETLTRAGLGGLLADRSLARALSSQLPGEDPALPVRIGASFRSHTGDYCRTFAVREGVPLTGLACRTSEGWRVRLLAETTPPPPAPGVTLPAALSRSLQAELGEPLEPKAEAEARARNWMP